MPRYEFKDKKSSKFWDIQHNGDSVEVRFGKIGTDGTGSSKVYASEEKALKEYESAIAGKLKKGYLLVDDLEPLEDQQARNPELEAALWADPNDLQAWSAYASFLEAEGDIRGRIIQLDLAGEISAANALQEEHLAIIAGVTLHKAMASIDEEPCLSTTWRRGFLISCRVATDWDHDAFKPASMLRKILKSHSARFLLDVRIGLVDTEGENNYAQTLNVLTSAGKLSALRYLHIGDFEYPEETEISWTQVGNISGIYPVAPNLKTLILTGGEIELGELKHPELVCLKLQTGGLPARAVTSVVTADLPKLVELEMWLGTEEYGGSAQITQLEPLMAGLVLPKLKKLGLKNAEIQNEIARAITVSPLLARLEHLDMSMGTMTDEGAQVILEHSERFKHLLSLNLSMNYISPEVCARLSAIFGDRVDLSEQEEPDDDGGKLWTYTSVSE